MTRLRSTPDGGWDDAARELYETFKAKPRSGRQQPWLALSERSKNRWRRVAQRAAQLAKEDICGYGNPHCTFSGRHMGSCSD